MANIVDPGGAKLCETASNPIPQGAKAGFFKTQDNVRLRYALWPKTSGVSKGTICLVHGRSEFIEKYYETIANFQSRGFNVATFDWRGQGGSDRLVSNHRLGYVERFDDYIIDLENFYSQILLPDCPPPFNLVGHSMGAFVSLLAASRNRLMFERLFLSAPMLSLDSMPLGLSAMANVAEALCFFGFGQMAAGRKDDRSPSSESFPGNELTSDFTRYMRVVDIYEKCPDLAISAPSFRWLSAAMRAMAKARSDDFPARIKTPVLMLAAARDKVVSTAAIEELGLRMRSGRHAVIAHARHELFMENDEIREQVFAAFDAFITEQTPA
ncbi:MAG: alpha/beta hydrolase [Devosiaceae bacterium]|nr:alpha/beta hydrolase [Devosiaceae bacterium]